MAKAIMRSLHFLALLGNLVAAEHDESTSVDPEVAAILADAEARIANGEVEYQVFNV